MFYIEKKETVMVRLNREERSELRTRWRGVACAAVVSEAKKIKRKLEKLAPAGTEYRITEVEE